jgi:copper(I)-binding protein
MRTLLLALIGLLPAAAATLAHDRSVGDITVEHAWARPSRTTNGAVYMVLKNAGGETDRLTGIAAGDVAASSGLHVTAVDAQGVATMRPVQAIDLPPGGEARLTPGGLHIMLLDLKAPLDEGEGFPLTLTFEKAGTVEVDVAVESKPSHGAEAGAAAHEHGHTNP